MEIFKDAINHGSVVFLTDRDLENLQTGNRLRGYMIKYLMIPIEYRYKNTTVLDIIRPAMPNDSEICYY